VAVNPYLIPGTDCLHNKLGFTDKTLLAEAELEITSARLIALEANPIPGKFDYDHLKAIHLALFKDIYDWAGQERTVQTIKGITRFEWPEKIQPNANKLLNDLKAENHLQNLERTQFIQRAAHYFGELNVIHPFPEGNGRAQRVLFDQIAKGAGFKFNWSRTTKDQLIDAVVYAYAVDTSKLEAVFEQTLNHRTRTIEQSNAPEFDFTIANPIKRSDYDNAVVQLASQRVRIENALKSDATLKPMQAEARKDTVSRELARTSPDALDIKYTFEANQQIESLFTQWQKLDIDIERRESGSDKEQSKLLQKQKSQILEKLNRQKLRVLKILIRSKNLSDCLTPVQREQVKNEYDRIEKTLSRQQSRDLGRGR